VVTFFDPRRLAGAEISGEVVTLRADTFEIVHDNQLLAAGHFTMLFFMLGNATPRRADCFAFTSITTSKRWVYLLSSTYMFGNASCLQITSTGRDSLHNWTHTPLLRSIRICQSNHDDRVSEDFVFSQDATEYVVISHSAVGADRPCLLTRFYT
jgi:hypothetical protein